MYRISNRSGQKMPTDIVKEGVAFRFFLPTGGKVESEELTEVMLRQKKRGFIKITKIEEVQEIEREEEINEDDVLASFDSEDIAED